MHMDRFVVITVKKEFEAVLLENDRHGIRMFNTATISIFYFTRLPSCRVFFRGGMTAGYHSTGKCHD